MNIMKEYEGIKRINNTLNFNIDDLYKMLLEYNKQIGNVSLEDNLVICDTNGKYCIHVYLKNNQIILERKTDNNETEETHKLGEDIKSVDMSITDRMIEQIYDFLVDYINNSGVVTEIITGVKKVLYSYQSDTMFSDIFFVKDNNNKNIYEIKNNKLFKEYSINNLILKRQDVKISYKEKENNKFEISKNPYTIISIQKNEAENKTTFIGNVNNKVLKLTADFTENHFIVELNEIVIGAIDSLDAENKNKYRLEINDLEYEYIIIALNVIIDMYLGEN